MECGVIYYVDFLCIPCHLTDSKDSLISSDLVEESVSELVEKEGQEVSPKRLQGSWIPGKAWLYPGLRNAENLASLKLLNE